MKKRTGFLLILFVVILVPLALLPIIVSSDVFVRFLTRSVNDRIPGSVQIATLQVGWSSGWEIRDIVYDDPLQGIRVAVPRLSCTQGLLALAASAGRNLGTIEMDSPVVEMSARPKPQSGQPSVQPEAGERESLPAPETGSIKQQEKKSPFWNDLLVNLLVRDGTIQHRKNDSRQTVVRNLVLDGEFTRGVLVYTLRMAPAGKEGWLSSKGKIDLPTRRDALLDALIAQVELSASAFPLQDVLDLAATVADLPRGKGVLTGNWLIRTTGTANLAVQGTLSLRDLQLEGGVLGEDHPVFREILLTLDAQRKDGLEIELNRLDLKADPGSFHARGQYGPGRIDLNGRGNLDLPVLFAQFPHLLRLQAGTRLDSGELTFAIDLQRKNKRMLIQANAEVARIRGLQDGRPLAWDVPLVLDLAAEQEDRLITINTVRITAPFLDLHGSGDLKQFTLQADMDLEKGSREIGKLFRIPWKIAGNLQLHTTSGTGEDKGLNMTGRMDIRDLTVSGKDTSILPKHPLSLDWTLKVPSLLESGSRKAMNLEMDLSSWLGKAHLVVADFEKGSVFPNGSFQLTADAGLGRVTDLLHNLGLMDRGMTLTGQARVHAGGTMKDDLLTLHSAKAHLSDFVLHNHGRTFRERNMRLYLGKPLSAAKVPVAIGKLKVYGRMDNYLQSEGGRCSIRFPARSVQGNDIHLNSSTLSVHDISFHLEDWSRPLETISLQSQGQADLRQVTDLLHVFGVLPPDLNLSGTSSLGLRLDTHDDSAQTSELEAELLSLVVTRSGNTLFSDGKIDLKLAGHGNLHLADLDGITIHLASTPLAMEAQGSVRGGELLVLEGKITPDLAAVASILGHLTGKRVEMAGRKTSPFQLKLPLGLSGTKRWQAAEARVELHARRIDYMGCRLQDLSFPVRLHNGVMELKLAGAFNGGQLDLGPKINFLEQPAQVTMARGSRFLQNVAIEGPLVDGLLKKIHPLFGVLAQPRGRISGRFDEFTWPLDKNGVELANFTTVFDTSKIELDSSGVLRELLALTGLEKESLTLKESEITCIGKQGRITCTPLRILVAESEMKLSGSVGMTDRSLDYLLEIPVTEKLVGREGYRVLAGTTIRVPIRGNAENPYYDGKALSSAISDLMAQAAGKAIEKQAEKILPDLFKGIFGK